MKRFNHWLGLVVVVALVLGALLQGPAQAVASPQGHRAMGSPRPSMNPFFSLLPPPPVAAHPVVPPPVMSSAMTMMPVHQFPQFPLRFHMRGNPFFASSVPLAMTPFGPFTSNPFVGMPLSGYGAPRTSMGSHANPYGASGYGQGSGGYGQMYGGGYGSGAGMGNYGLANLQAGQQAYANPSTTTTNVYDALGVPNNGRQLTWPLGLRILPPAAETEALRRQLDALLPSLGQPRTDGGASSSALEEANRVVDQLQARLRTQKDGGGMAAHTYTEAERFLQQLKQGLKAIR
jgi:hypothetical protein